ncbi:MAG: hypothetical protein CL946_12045 [Ectothiorhodospiraceae bacterium]|nr:hypothetical protein [Ectothiorhodospiraceae bacterium]
MKRILFVVALLSIQHAVLAGGWPQEEGSGYYKLGIQIVKGDQYYTETMKIPVATLEDNTLFFYGEYGLTNNITVFTYLPFYRSLKLSETENTSQTPGENTGISDGDIGVRIGLWQGSGAALAGVLALGVPLGDDKVESGLRTGYGVWSEYAGLEYGYSLYPIPGWISASMGVNIRGGSYGNEIRYGLDAGYRPLDDVIVMLKVAGIQPLRDGDNSFQPGELTGLYPNNQRYLSYGLEVGYALTESFTLSVGAASGTLVQNALSALAYTAGLSVSH